MDTKGRGSSGIFSASHNKNQARLRLVVNLDEYRIPLDSHGSGHSVGPSGSSSGSSRRRDRIKLISEKLMSGDASAPLDSRKMSGVYPGLPVQPLPNESGGNADIVGERGLSARDLHGPLDSFLPHTAETSAASHEIQEPGSWRQGNCLNSLAGMSKTKKRPLTEEEKKIAQLIREQVARSGETQDAIAARIGVTQGALWQWMKGETPVSAKSAQSLATAIGLAPAQVSVAWRKLYQDAKKVVWPFPKIHPKRWSDLTDGQKIRIEGLVLGEIVDIESKNRSRAG